ncbi:MAG: hypothetical protein ACI9QD_001060, partial [Thermoproteota archaeon]
PKTPKPRGWKVYNSNLKLTIVVNVYNHIWLEFRVNAQKAN